MVQTAMANDKANELKFSLPPNEISPLKYSLSNLFSIKISVMFQNQNASNHKSIKIQWH